MRRKSLLMQARPHLTHALLTPTLRRFSPVPVSMPAADSPITRQTVGKTFTTAISILGVGAMVQLGAIGWIFYSRFQTTPLPAGPLAGSDTGPLNRDFNDPFGDAVPPGGSGAFNPSPMAVIPARPVPDSQFTFKPVPINPEAPARATASAPSENTRFSELIDQARICLLYTSPSPRD